MKVIFSPVSEGNGRYPDFSIIATSEDEEEIFGSMRYDVEVKSWKVDGSIRRCLELLTSNPEWKKGFLGASEETAILIVAEVLGAWFLLTRAPTEAPLKIHKLDIRPNEEESEFVDLYDEFRPLVSDRLSL